MTKIVRLFVGFLLILFEPIGVTFLVGFLWMIIGLL